MKEDEENLLPKMMLVTPPKPFKYDSEIGDYREILSGTTIFSIENQMNFILTRNVVVKIKVQTLSGYIYVIPQHISFNFPGQIPTPINVGCDEWSLKHSETLPYKVPKPLFYL